MSRIKLKILRHHWKLVLNLLHGELGNKVSYKNKVYRSNESWPKYQNVGPFTTLNKMERKTRQVQGCWVKRASPNLTDTR